MYKELLPKFRFVVMKLYTDPGNFQTIKVLSAAKLAGVPVQKTDVKPGSE